MDPPWDYIWDEQGQEQPEQPQQPPRANSEAEIFDNDYNLLTEQIGIANAQLERSPTLSLVGHNQPPIFNYNLNPAAAPQSFDFINQPASFVPGSLPRSPVPPPQRLNYCPDCVPGPYQAYRSDPAAGLVGGIIGSLGFPTAVPPVPHPHSINGYLGASDIVQPPSTALTQQLLPLDAPAMTYNHSGQFHGADLAHSGLYKTDSYSPEPAGDNATDGGSAESRQQHRRGYQACQRCRERKVKCDLGSVDAPTDPPCKRCQRERLHCEFAPTRKKQKRSDGTARDVSQDPALGNNDTPVTGNGSSNYAFKPTQASSSSASPLKASPLTATNGFTGQTWSQQNPQHSVTSQPRDMSARAQIPPMLPPAPVQRNPFDVELHSQVAVATLGPQVSSTQDNIMLLVDAAYATASEGATPHPKDSPHSERGERKRTLSSLDHGGPQVPTDTGFTPQEQAEQQAGLKAWSEMRFVRNGWFTAWEAMQYVEYFFKQLAPMTPIVFDEYRSPHMHQNLLVDEPILALAILAIASRHMPLSGHAALSRSYQIHGKLWNNLRRQIERLLWGQEQFGGGFCGGGNSNKIRESNTGQITWKGSLRTLGTIEALLLLTDWQPRALHFPPSDDEEGLLDRSVLMSAEEVAKTPAQNGESAASRDYDNLPYASWLEPAWRSDRMSWMLLGLAQSLAFELGVFDTNHSNCGHDHGPNSECAHKRRIRHLILVYVAQTSGRMGVQSSLNVEEWQKDAAWDQTKNFSAEHPVDIMQERWVHIARIMNQANRDIFPSHQYTRYLISSGKYKDSIATFAPLLQNWKIHFDKVKDVIHPVMQSILIVEYEYARLYINSLGLQHVVESWVQGGSNIRKATLWKIAEDNKLYIDEVTDAALNILDEVVDGIAGRGFLRDAPVRTYLRSLSGIMFTLKRFSLGTHETLVRKCLQQLEKITMAMSKEVVDDVHLTSSTSRLVQNIVRNVKQTLIRVQQVGNGSGGPSREHSRPQSANSNDGNHEAHQQQAQAINLNQFNATFHMDDPLAEIQARPMAELASQMFVPPPNFSVDGQILDSALPEDSHLDPTMTLSMDWFALPLDNLFSNDEATVDQGFGGLGPTVGTRDMLEVITNRDYNQMQWNSNQTFGFGNL
ncbi:zinc finger transcriptional activator [Exophiala xenobiotica]|uniref:Zinc finger transcriptional activator n=1 Tax=Vermiconidia calcicola TaxID=1690605 RepID=A0AAV9PZ91_9PEZI|nr:zinc finger transcriptional activator [Exophiala xenobiotica]KAK5531681.1 zinc finger transcriptional activator [Chaetothyriales sp. CCFEE 6169]KAK5532439.1 zinc finger transcriptional activator [Vermiconidia calcicola]KAK5295584.1 zinc finger transcriptional activator [Exophiala xenobiotica]KAK5333813.1 zinc finger transcriptional activator [Exophiala xenobiotica]